MSSELEHLQTLVPGEIASPGNLRPTDLLGKVLTVESFYISTPEKQLPLYRKDDGRLLTSAEIVEGTPGEGWIEIYAREARTGERRFLEERIVSWNPNVPHDREEVMETPVLAKFVAALEDAGHPTLYKDELPSLASDNRKVQSEL